MPSCKDGEATSTDARPTIASTRALTAPPFGTTKVNSAAETTREISSTISHSPTLLRFLIELVGAERVMLGSDYCFDMGYIRPREIVEKRLRLSRPDQRRILGATAARLLSIG